MTAYSPDALIAADIDTYLHQHEQKTLLRFLTCGSVDDGKSTLIGRLLYDARAIFDDQLASLEADSRRVGTQGQGIDFALLVDGLAAEREQGITIDVAYRFFATERRKFIVADTPGHEQYTRNMVTGASTADLAIVLVDARKGVLTQTRRHGYLAHLLGIRHTVLAVNKLDLIGWDQAAFDAIVTDFSAFATSIGMAPPLAVPISGLGGDNIARRSAATPWYGGPTLLDHLETVEVESDVAAAGDFAMPVQWVNRPDLDFRGFAGLVSSGTVRPGDPVRIVPSGRTSSVARIVAMGGDLSEARAGQSVTLTLSDEVDCSRGDVIAAADAAPQVADQFAATLVWLDEAPLLPGRGYWLKSGATTVTATVRPPEHAVDVNTLAELSVKTLGLNDIGVAHVHTDRAIPYAPYSDNRDLGGFILIDKATNATVAAGLIDWALRRAANIHWQAIEITREAHAAQKGQAPRLLWFTGLSGSGKSTIANLVEKRLHALGKHSFMLDGDNIRHGLNRDLGFSDADRIENIRRVGEVARLMTDAGLIVLSAFISPFRAERDMVRRMMPEGEFLEIFVDTPLAVAEARDVKGLYARARAGEIRDFTGISSPYEPPLNPDVHIDTTRTTPEEAAELIVETLLGVWSWTL
ncbi:adenylylsulfate kinase /sulfate adenylyltransferase subunit 1 [Sphingomonas guangdongensis]|uniref:Multifunctional fusion protein n=1 Tax=Sphingomonas guangdongensis TaxID=1141890 RepID=A0A285QYE3_9SPHN|nr:sulfate adenylyltransferase subunit CysN [Sphingomonas guangdongensis]SOB86851.1 adenylylsulfate kinase /sulfate adenylyltransferase subunit 1 [Sphingomonas guangdongensis]